MSRPPGLRARSGRRLNRTNFCLGAVPGREENVWVSTNGGIDRFSKTNAVRVLLPLCSGIGYALGREAGRSGRVPEERFPVGSLTEIRNGSIVGQQDTEKFTAGYRDAQGGIWLGGPNALGHLESGRVATTPLQRSYVDSMSLITRDRDGTLWVAIATKGMFPRYQRALVLVRVTPTVWQHWQTPRSTRCTVVWLHRQSSRAMQDGKVRLFDARDVSRSATSRHPCSGRRDLAGGELGFARMTARVCPGTEWLRQLLHGISGMSYEEW